MSSWFTSQVHSNIGIATPDLDGWNYSGAAGYGQEIE